jgi:hypothetical protein
MKVRVISDTTTFYPVESDEDAHQCTDNMTLRTTLVYLHEQMGEDFQFLVAEDLFVVLQQWRGIFFFIQSTDARYREVMRLQIQTIREILIFLFGVKFESVMKFHILLGNRIVFAQYVDTYLAACNSDYLCLIGASRADTQYIELAGSFLGANAQLYGEFDLKLFTCILFHDHQIVGRFIVPDSVQFEPETIMILTIFERVEYQTIAHPPDEKFSSAYVTSVDNKSMKHKTAFLRVERTPVACTISSTRCGVDSPFVILVVTQTSAANHRKSEMQMKIVDFLTAVTTRLPSVVPRPAPLRVDVPEELLHSVVIDRTRGTVWELPEEISVRLLQEYLAIENEADAAEEARRVKDKLAAYGTTAMMRGFTTMMWGEINYQFCYELRFEDDTGQQMRPNQVFSAPPFNDDTGLNYRLIADSLFQSDRRVTCLELFAVYRGEIQVKQAIAADQALFEMFKRQS